jgi:hypothetical protein
MAYEPLDFSQPNNELSRIAEEQRKRLIPRNDFKPLVNEYSQTNPDAVSDGDDMGRGTGTCLDVYNNNGGTIVDINERKNEIKINKYKQSNPYTIPSD